MRFNLFHTTIIVAARPLRAHIGRRPRQFAASTSRFRRPFWI